MFDLHWSDFSEEWKRFGMPLIVGDQKADAEQFRATSPLRQVARIKVPVLLAHGSNDERVPIAHSSKFKAAADSAGVNVDWVVYKDEWHGWHRKETNIDFWTRVEAFLAKSLDIKTP